MGDQWMLPRTLRISSEDLRLVPPHPNWQYEAQPDGKTALLLPKPRFGNALLNIKRWQCPGPSKPVALRAWNDSDPMDLAPLFAEAFATLEPLAGLGDIERQAAAQEALFDGWEGKFGPVSPTSVVAMGEEGEVLGGLMITLLPGGNLDGPGAWRWLVPPPLDLESMGLGLPHLTWIFVAAKWQHCGVGAALLSHAIYALRQKGYSQLATTFLTGNHASTLWHWRMGFELMSWLPSPRLRQG